MHIKLPIQRSGSILIAKQEFNPNHNIEKLGWEQSFLQMGTITIFNIYKEMRLPIPSGSEVKLGHLLISNLWSDVRLPVNSGKVIKWETFEIPSICWAVTHCVPSSLFSLNRFSSSHFTIFSSLREVRCCINQGWNFMSNKSTGRD